MLLVLTERGKTEPGNLSFPVEAIKLICYHEQGCEVIVGLQDGYEVQEPYDYVLAAFRMLKRGGEQPTLEEWQESSNDPG